MMTFRKLWKDRSAAAAAEMALVAPLLLVLLVGAIETGNYFLSEHVLVKGVRDGARYAARQSFFIYPACTGGSQNITGTTYNNTKLLVRKGSLNSADRDRIANWTHGGTVFTLELKCTANTSGQNVQGIYKERPGGAPIVTVSATVPYRPVMPVFGSSSLGLKLNAKQQASVMGI
jgi:Flp pilus assembly protein TadG